MGSTSTIWHIHANGVFTQAWWDQFLPILHGWGATRPRAHAYLTSRAQDRFQALERAWVRSVAPHIDNSDISGVEWHQVASFRTLVAEIKNVRSPVFPAKFCHFLAPRIFPVVDNTAMGNPYRTYESYFTTAREEWFGTGAAVHDELVTLLRHEIRAPLFSDYPMKCKVIELCLIGRYNGG
jgi:hypothetical protein